MATSPPELINTNTGEIVDDVFDQFKKRMDKTPSHLYGELLSAMRVTRLQNNVTALFYEINEDGIQKMVALEKCIHYMETEVIKHSCPLYFMNRSTPPGFTLLVLLAGGNEGKGPHPSDQDYEQIG